MSGKSHGFASAEEARAYVESPEFRERFEQSKRTIAYLGQIQAVARECGYAVAVHGSEARDLDVLAVPWAVEAVSAQQLVDALCERLGLEERKVNTYADPEGPRIEKNPEPKPWGRWAWSLSGCPAPWQYLDLSVAPRAGEAVPIIRWDGA